MLDWGLYHPELPCLLSVFQTDLLVPGERAGYLIGKGPEESGIGVLGHIGDSWKLIHWIGNWVHRNRGGGACDVLETVIPVQIKVVSCIEESADRIVSVAIAAWFREVVSVVRKPDLVRGVDWGLVSNSIQGG